MQEKFLNNNYLKKTYIENIMCLSVAVIDFYFIRQAFALKILWICPLHV